MGGGKNNRGYEHGEAEAKKRNCKFKGKQSDLARRKSAGDAENK